MGAWNLQGKSLSRLPLVPAEFPRSRHRDFRSKIGYPVGIVKQIHFFRREKNAYSLKCNKLAH